MVDCSLNWGIPWQSFLFVVIAGSVLWGFFCSPFACSHFSLATGPGDTIVSPQFQVTDRFPFPMEIDMSEYTEHGRSEEGTLYELYAVIVHGGSCEGGHYTACIRDIDNLGHWEDPVSLFIDWQLLTCFL